MGDRLSAEGQPGLVLQWGHGREAMDGGPTRVHTLRGRYFNGAMAVRPWMAVPLSRALAMSA